jgi:hypothetical protein
MRDALRTQLSVLHQCNGTGYPCASITLSVHTTIACATGSRLHATRSSVHAGRTAAPAAILILYESTPLTDRSRERGKRTRTSRDVTERTTTRLRRALQPLNRTALRSWGFSCKRLALRSAPPHRLAHHPKTLTFGRATGIRATNRLQTPGTQQDYRPLTWDYQENLFSPELRGSCISGPRNVGRRQGSKVNAKASGNEPS